MSMQQHPILSFELSGLLAWQLTKRDFCEILTAKKRVESGESPFLTKALNRAIGSALGIREVDPDVMSALLAWKRDGEWIPVCEKSLEDHLGESRI